GDWQHGNAWMLTELISLNHQGGPRLAKVALQGNGHKVPACHPVQPSPPVNAASISCCNSESVLSAWAIKRLWRRHSSANSARLVSGTQICTGRKPALRKALRCF